MKPGMHRSQIANRRRRREPWKGVRLAHGASRGFTASERSHPGAGPKDSRRRSSNHRFLSPVPGAVNWGVVSHGSRRGLRAMPLAGLLTPGH